MLGLKLIHVSKRGHMSAVGDEAIHMQKTLLCAHESQNL